MAACLLAGLLALGAHSAPRLPPGALDTLWPLAVGNTWTWHTNYGDMTERVARREPVSERGGPPVDCYVLETTTAESPDKIVQTEFVTVADHELRVIKRRYPGEETVLSPPEVLMREPVVVGEAWTWSGETETGQARMDFKVLHAEALQVPAVKTPLICQRIDMQGQSANGGAITVSRWYAPGIGMVKETSVMTKGQQSMTVNGVLKSYHVETGK